MSMELFWQGLVLGLAIAAPVGPIGVLTIRRTVVGGWPPGLFSGLGAATADAFYGSIAALGLTAVSAFLIQFQSILQLSGGLFLLYLGVQTMRVKIVNSEPFSVSSEQFSGGNEQSFTNREALAEESIHNSQLTRAYISTLFLTLSNPITILSFTAVFAGFGVGSQTSHAGSGILLVAGVFCGSALWWLFLTGMVTAVRGKLMVQGKLNERIFRFINLASGIILIGFSLLLLSNLFL